MTNMRVIEHRWLLNNTKNTGQQSTSSANTLIFRPSLITLFKAELAVQMYICQWVQHCWAWISLQLGVTMLNNIVDNIEQCWQQNNSTPLIWCIYVNVQACLHQTRTGCPFLLLCKTNAVYNMIFLTKNQRNMHDKKCRSLTVKYKGTAARYNKWNRTQRKIRATV